MINVACYVHWANVGGAEDMIIDEIKFANRKEINYIFITEEDSGWNVVHDELQSMGVPIFRVTRDNVSEVEAIYSREHIQILHVLSCGHVEAAFEAAVNLNIPVVDVQACVAYSAGYERWGLPKVQPVYLSQKHLEHGGGGKKEFKVIVGGVDVDSLSSKYSQKSSRRNIGLHLDRQTVGWFGRFDQFKCPYSFIQIAKFIRENKPETQFVMFGDGIDKGHAEFLAKEAGLDVKFTGFTRNKYDAFNCMDVYCFPTWQEAFGRVMAEAMAVGVPIVTSDYQVCKELCGDAALYATLGREDPLPRAICQEYADKIIALLDDAVMKTEMIDEGTRRATEMFDARRMSLEYQKLYEEMVNGIS